MEIIETEHFDTLVRLFRVIKQRDKGINMTTMMRLVRTHFPKNYTGMNEEALKELCSMVIIGV